MIWRLSATLQMIGEQVTQFYDYAKMSRTLNRKAEREQRTTEYRADRFDVFGDDESYLDTSKLQGFRS